MTSSFVVKRTTKISYLPLELEEFTTELKKSENLKKQLSEMKICKILYDNNCIINLREV